MLSDFMTPPPATDVDRCRGQPLRRALFRWLGLGLALASAASFSMPVQVAQGARVIVSYRAEPRPVVMSDASAGVRTGGAARSLALGQRLGLELSSGRWIGPDTQVLSARGLTASDLVHRLQSDPEVAHAVVDGRVHAHAAPNDPLYASVPVAQATGGPAAGQWALKPVTAQTPSAIDAESAWPLTTGADVVVAVLDTGVLPGHPDLQGRLLPGRDFVSSLPQANDGNGPDGEADDPGDGLTDAEVNAVGGAFYGGAPTHCSRFNVLTGRYEPVDSSWHGTKISAIVAARANDGYGMSGVAPDARILPVRVLGKCGGVDSDIIAGMRWAAGLEVDGLPGAAAPRARVLNLSLGGVGPCSAAYQQAIDDVIARGVVVIVAAGNSAGQAVGTPANCRGVIAVGGLRHVGTKVGFSDLGPAITLSAPGGNCVNIRQGEPCLYPLLTATNGGVYGPDPLAYRHTDSFDFTVGTSFATGLVSGAAALMLSVRPDLTVWDVQEILRSSARPFPTAPAGDTVPECRLPDAQEQLECHCTTALCGAGMLDARAAVEGARAWVAASPAPVSAGGAMSWPWLLGLLAAGLWLRRR
ncbi:MAG: S8 family peptidase [Rubrivivax sp.]